MNVKINNQNFKFLFGIGFIRKLGESRNFYNYPDTIEYIVKNCTDFKKISFQQEDLIKDILYFGAVNAGEPKAEQLKELQILEFVLEQTETFNAIIEGLGDSLKKIQPGKPQPQKAATKRRTTTRK